MIDLHSLSNSARSAAMRGGTAAWGEMGSIHNVRYGEPVPSKSRRRCHCGCGKRATHFGMANGVSLNTGCELSIARWVRNPMS